MFAPDVLTCYAITGLSALGGLGLLALVESDQPRVRYALRLFRWALAAFSALLLSSLVPATWHPLALQLGISLASAGVALLAWGFRHLHGGRTPPTWGLVACVMVAGVPAVVALAGNAHAYVCAIGVVFALSSGYMAIDQSLVVCHQRRAQGADRILLVAAWLFCLDWLALCSWAVGVPGPYPAHWLHAPVWLLAPTSLAFAVLPLGVAAVVFAAINARLNQQLRARALSDELTGVLSRRGLRELGERLLSLQAQPKQVLAVLMLDIDLFKAVNLRHGHKAGDQVLRHVASVVREHLREDALVARYGGEEFTIVLPVRSRSEGLLVAERLRERMSEGDATLESEAGAHGADCRLAMPAAIGADIGKIHGACLGRIPVLAGRCVADVERHLAAVKAGVAVGRVRELDPGERAMGMDRLVHAGEDRDIAVVPEPALDQGRQVAGRMDVGLLCADHSPAALGLHRAHGDHRTRKDDAHAVAVRHLEEAVLGDDRADADRVEQDVISGVARHGCSESRNIPIGRPIHP